MHDLLGSSRAIGWPWSPYGPNGVAKREALAAVPRARSEGAGSKIRTPHWLSSEEPSGGSMLRPCLASNPGRAQLANVKPNTSRANASHRWSNTSAECGHQAMLQCQKRARHFEPTQRTRARNTITRTLTCWRHKRLRNLREDVRVAQRRPKLAQERALVRQQQPLAAVLVLGLLAAVAMSATVFDVCRTFRSSSLAFFCCV